MAATAAANAAAAADPSLLTQHFAAYSGSIEPNASSLSIPATSSYQSDQPSSLSAGAAAAAAGTAGPVVRQQQQIESPAAAGSGPEWYKNVVQLTGDVAAALEPAMRGQYKVIHILRCPFIAGRTYQPHAAAHLQEAMYPPLAECCSVPIWCGHCWRVLVLGPTNLATWHC